MSKKPYPWGRKTTRIFFFPGTAAIGLGLYAAPGMSAGIATLIVVILAITSALVGVACAFAPYLAEIVDALSKAADRRAERKREIRIIDAREIIQAEAASQMSGPTRTAFKSSDCGVFLSRPAETDRLESEAPNPRRSPTAPAEPPHS